MDFCNAWSLLPVEIAVEKWFGAMLRRLRLEVLEC